VLSRPVITATQMLESMVNNPRPTRAEASDVANAILDGTDAVMLSNETAVGNFPVEAVATMARIARRIEQEQGYAILQPPPSSSVPNAISQAVGHIAEQLKAAAIMPLTQTGATARNVSKFRPTTPILAVTPNVDVARQLQMVWGVHPLLVVDFPSTSQTFRAAIGTAQDNGLLQEGDLVVMTAGTLPGVSGSTDLIKVEIVTTVLARGSGIGHGSISGKVRVVDSPAEASKLSSGEILVAKQTSADYIEAIRRAGGIVTEEAGPNCHAAVIGQRLGIPVIVGAANATNLIRNGSIVTLDSRRGTIYSGALGSVITETSP
jgi:pyruvate kinase